MSDIPSQLDILSTGPNPHPNMSDKEGTTFTCTTIYPTATAEGRHSTVWPSHEATVVLYQYQFSNLLHY